MYSDIFLKKRLKNIASVFYNYNPYYLLSNTEEFIYDLAKKYYKIDNSKIYNNVVIEGDVFISDNVVIQPFTTIIGPVIIGSNTFIGSGSLIRNNVFIGDNSIVGYCNEIGNSVVLNNTLVSHFNNISYSIIGNNVHLGAHVATMSNLLVNEDDRKKSKTVDLEGFSNSGRIKLYRCGAIIGDYCKIGAYVGTNPGTIIEEGTYVYPGVILSSGRYAKNSIITIKNYKKNIVISNLERELV